VDAKSWDWRILERPKSPSLTLLSSPRKTAMVSRWAVMWSRRRTVLRLQVPMKNHRSLAVADRLCIRAKSHDIASSRRRVFSKVAAVEGADDLAEDAPDELLLAQLVLVLQIADDAPEVAVPAVFHVQVQVLGRLDVVALEIRDDVGMAKFLEDGELGLELFTFFRRHLLVADLLSAEDLWDGKQLRRALH
jgi:hypothetical protein